MIPNDSLSRRRTDLRVVIVTGQTAAGKSSLADVLRQAGFPTAEFSQFFEDRLELAGLGRSKRYAAVSDYIRAVGRAAFIRLFLRWSVLRNKDRKGLPLVLVGARHPDDIAVIKEQCRVLEVVGVVAPTRERARRIETRVRPMDARHQAPACDRLVTICIRRHATVVMQNDGPRDRFQMAARAFARKLKRAARRELDL